MDDATPPKKPTRRILLGGALGAAAVGAAYAGGWYWFKVRTGDTEAMILSVLRRNLRDLEVREEDLRAFALELQERFAEHRRLAMLGMLAPLYEHVDLYDWVPGAQPSFRRFEDTVVGEFLMSTDFFEHGPDSGQPLTYYGPYTPYLRICGNPFAELDEPGG